MLATSGTYGTRASHLRPSRFEQSGGPAHPTNLFPPGQPPGRHRAWARRPSRAGAGLVRTVWATDEGHYAVNTGVPKTLAAAPDPLGGGSKQFDERVGEVLPVDPQHGDLPELVPAKPGEKDTVTQDRWPTCRTAVPRAAPYGTARPSKIAFLAEKGLVGCIRGFPGGQLPRGRDKVAYSLWRDRDVGAPVPGVSSASSSSAAPCRGPGHAGGSLSPRGDAPSGRVSGRVRSPDDEAVKGGRLT